VLLQVIVAVGQAEDCTALLAAAARAGYSCVLGVYTAIQGVSNAAGVRGQL
jgi:hypothetical protein